MQIAGIVARKMILLFPSRTITTRARAHTLNHIQTMQSYGERDWIGDSHSRALFHMRMHNLFVFEHINYAIWKGTPDSTTFTTSRDAERENEIPLTGISSYSPVILHSGHLASLLQRDKIFHIWILNIFWLQKTEFYSLSNGTVKRLS